MKTLVIYYSYSGNTRKTAAGIAGERSATLVEVSEKKKRGRIGVYFTGCPAAMMQKKAKLSAPLPDMAEYDEIVIAVPLWAGFPAPAFNNIIEQLPQGKNVEIIIVSGGGDSSGTAQRTKELVEGRGCRVTSYQDIKL